MHLFSTLPQIEVFSLFSWSLYLCCHNSVVPNGLCLSDGMALSFDVRRYWRFNWHTDCSGKPGRCASGFQKCSSYPFNKSTKRRNEFCSQVGFENQNVTGLRSWPIAKGQNILKIYGSSTSCATAMDMTHLLNLETRLSSLQERLKGCADSLGITTETADEKQATETRNRSRLFCRFSVPHSVFLCFLGDLP